MSHYKPDPNKSVTLTIDGIPVTVPEGTRILEAAQKVKVRIPTLCDHPALGKRAVCRICVVECDGRGKLMAACANYVAEGMNIVTSNARITAIRKMIVELLLANHPQECLTCVRSKKCELQSLAEQFSSTKPLFRNEAMDRQPPKTENGTLVRDMAKCVRCGRCVEACQERQTVRAINSAHRSIEYEICTPYGQDLSGGTCIFCGQCADVCPVGALYEYDQSAEVWEALYNSDKHVVAQIGAQAGRILDDEFGLPPGTITNGAMVSALKHMGFNKVFDAGFFAGLTRKEEYSELLARLKNNGQPGKPLPLIISESPDWLYFTEKFYPDLVNHLPLRESPQSKFGTMAKASESGLSGLDPAKITPVSVVPGISEKYEAQRLGMGANGSRHVDIALTVKELARMIRLAGIDLKALPESPFDSVNGDSATDDPFTALSRLDFTEVDQGLKEAELDLDGSKIKVLAVNGLANARKVMDSIRKGECKAALVEVNGINALL